MRLDRVPQAGQEESDRVLQAEPGAGFDRVLQAVLAGVLDRDMEAWAQSGATDVHPQPEDESAARPRAAKQLEALLSLEVSVIPDQVALGLEGQSDGLVFLGNRREALDQERRVDRERLDEWECRERHRHWREGRNNR